MSRLHLVLCLLGCLSPGCARPVPPALVDGSSEAACSSWTCPGCCSAGQCRSGKDPSACGAAGKACASCAPGEACVDGACKLACTPTEVKPVSAQVYFGTVCNESAVLTRDDVFAGLDKLQETDRTTIAGQSESACIEVDFGAPVMMDTLVVRAKSVDQACSKACTACTEGRAFGLFHGVSKGSYSLAGDDSTVTPTAADYTYPMGKLVRYAVICRLDFWQEKADVAVDYLHGTTCK